MPPSPHMSAAAPSATNRWDPAPTSTRTYSRPRRFSRATPRTPVTPRREHRPTVRGAPPSAPPGYRNQPLDMDVIDVSWMDNNVHSLRHSFFNVNRWIIDDLREILSTQRRARDRTARMTHRFANVYSFLAAPSYVVNP